ncbi:19787_t:CDS:1, partial [Racocetra persica]
GMYFIILYTTTSFDDTQIVITLYFELLESMYFIVFCHVLEYLFDDTQIVITLYFELLE